MIINLEKYILEQLEATGKNSFGELEQIPELEIAYISRIIMGEFEYYFYKIQDDFF